jgi:hypothetical protein
MSWSQGRSVAGKIKSVEKFKNIRNQTHDLPACSVVPQPTMSLHAPTWMICTVHSQIMAHRKFQGIWGKAVSAALANQCLTPTLQHCLIQNMGASAVAECIPLTLALTEAAYNKWLGATPMNKAWVSDVSVKAAYFNDSWVLSYV